MTVHIRSAASTDGLAVREVQLSAFATGAEADLVDRLVRDGDAVISLVATEGEEIVGHVMLSRMAVQADGRHMRSLGLAPVAVVPRLQGRGIGSRLIQTAISRARTIGIEIIFVLGEPEYYRRFGFDVATARPFESPYAGVYFQALDLAGLPAIRSGRAAYAKAFDALG